MRKGAYIDLKIMIEGIMYKFNTCRGDQTKKDKLEVLMNKIDTYLKRFSTPLKTRRTQRKNQKEIEAGFEKVQAEPQKTLPVGTYIKTPLKDHLSASSASKEASNFASSEVRSFTDSTSSNNTIKDIRTRKEEKSNNLGFENDMKAWEPIVRLHAKGQQCAPSEDEPCHSFH
ncbi:MAG: hypothetical protein GX762_04485 [Bacteroidales bacterium]|nr:hypothetical protein [Bacteroidales bacterium]